MKLVKKRMIIIIILLIGLIGLDVLDTFQFKKPLFVLNTAKTEDKTTYQGLLFDVHDCKLCDSQKVVIKSLSYECPEENHEKRASLTLVGDLLFEYPYYDDIQKGTDRSLYFNRIKSFFEDDDLSIANMEVPIDNGHLPISGEGYSFCAPQWVGNLVASLDFELLGTANNHALDRGAVGINSTINFFKYNSDFMTVGTYQSREDRNDYRILEINGIRFGFLAYTYETNVDPEYGEEYRVGYYSDPHTYEVTEAYKEIMRSEVTALRQSCDVLVVLMHWGREFTFEPNQEQYDMATFLNALGVDLIVGSHSHNIQPIEMIGDEHQTLVYYSLGNFVSADEDLDRTYDDETFDNAYQVGMLSKLEVVVGDKKDVRFENIDTEMIVNYFDKDSRYWELVPFSQYDSKYETTHQRYALGLTKAFIQDIFENVVDEKYRQ